MGRILSAFLMLGISSMCGAQIYKYLGIEDGLSNRRIYRIQKDGRGYMWFLTQEGMDRYDGKRIRHYTVLDGNLKVAPQVNLNWLYTDTENTLWVVGRKGRIFHYDTLHDRFRMVYRIPGLQDDFATGMLCYAYMDRGDRIWLCQGDHIIRYDTRTGIAQRLVSRLRGDITAISETDGTNLFIGTVNGLFPVRERDGVLEALADTDSIRTPVSELYYHPGSKKLFVGTFRKGILVYGVSAGSTLRNVAVNRITPLNDRELLIATGGRGVYRMDMDSLVPKPYITADYASHNGMNGDNINDIYVDGGDRIWLANYPAGVTIRNNRYQSYEWFRHSPGNSRSLVNDQVHDVIEDSEGDLWFATSNGISLLQPAVGRWRSFLSRSDGIQDGGNHIFLTLCEVSPGVICAGGYASGLYRIEKKTERVEYFPPSFAAEGRPDQYINDIGKDSGGCIWTGGCHNLKRFDPHDGTVRLYPVPGPITAILEKAPEWMWIGTGMGLYLLDGHGGTCRHIAFPVEAVHVYALYQAPDGLLYIGTGGAGLLVYDSVEDRFVRQYQTENCALISNNIHTIVPRADGTLLLGTENSVALFRRESGTFRNWTAEQGLASVCLNAGVSTFRHGESFVFGSNTGAVMFPSDMRIPAPHFSRMLLRDFMISYRPVYPGDKGSPLREDIDNTVRLELAYDQNTFSLEAVSINYDYPSNILYSWKLEGLYEGWSHPVQSGRIQFTSLPPGNYTLRIRAVSNEEKYKVYEERKKLFRNHFRGSNAVNLQVAGNGVGLMMVHRLVRLHGGRVRVTSTEGKGTMVCVIFPMRSRRLDKACPVASPRKQDTGETRMGPDCGPMREILPTMTGGDRQRILIVEDNDDLRTYLEGLLKEEYLVQTCSNGRDALLVAREYNPDLILSDVMMPEMGGDELCASVKSDIETSHIPVMLLTALGDEKDMLEGLENGADAYITKPFSINVLRANIRNILANRALLRRAYAGLEDGVGQVPPDCHNTRDWKFMASVRECVMKNIDNPGFCVDMLCGMQNMSRTGFFNKLKALTGHAPADYIRSMRLQYAAQLLREKDCSITEISDDSGFSDVRYFREVFRKYYGMSPSEYRNSMRG